MEKSDIKENRNLWGASILAGLVFWVLNFGAGIILEFDSPTRAFLSATIKAVIFAFVFNYLHNKIARLFGWYKTDE